MKVGPDSKAARNLSAIMQATTRARDIVIKLYNPCGSTEGDAELNMSFTLKGATLDSQSFSSSIGDNATADLTFSALQITAVSAFTEAPNFAVVDLLGGQSQKFLTGRKLATWGASLELSTTLGAAATPASANWIAWNNGDVSTITQDVLYGRLTALRFTRVSGTNADTYEVMA
jgi:hypothetical protein